MSEAKYKRVLLKLSGEALAGEQKTGVNVEVVGKICDKIKEVTEMGVEVGIVVGGGNFWRGRNGHLSFVHHHLKELEIISFLQESLKESFMHYHRHHSSTSSFLWYLVLISISR